MKVELMFCEETILQEIAEKGFTRDDVALNNLSCEASFFLLLFGKRLC